MINFLKYKKLFFSLSLLFILPSAYFLIRFGLKPSVDFTGGTLLELQLIPLIEQEVTRQTVLDLAKDDLEITSLQTSKDNVFIIRAPVISQEEVSKFEEKLQGHFKEVNELRFESVGPTLGKELIQKTLIGVLIATTFILFYVATRFKDKKYGVCAILAMLHDTFILIGTFSFLGVYFNVEVDALFVTAVLTILSFSVHDTIVVYDRIRESIAQNPKMPFPDVVNKAITETLGRSVNNSLTIIFMLLSLYLLGGETTKWFVFALLIGTISGTYSSTFTAAPLLVLWEELRAKKGK